MSIGENIKQTRKIVGLTQKQLGEKLGMSGAAISNFEASNNIRFETLSKIAGALGVSAVSLLDPDSLENEQIINQRIFGHAGLDNLLQLSDADRKALHDQQWDKLDAFGQTKVIEYTEDISDRYKK